MHFVESGWLFDYSVAPSNDAIFQHQTKVCGWGTWVTSLARSWRRTSVIIALEHFPLDLRHIIERFAPQPTWNDYMTGRYKETKNAIRACNVTDWAGLERRDHRMKVEREGVHQIRR